MKQNNDLEICRQKSKASPPELNFMKTEGGLRIQKKIFKKSKKNKPLITVITAVFNGQKHLEKTIQSVLGQTYCNVEYILIDGLSSDHSLEIIKKYESKIDYWLSEEDGGIYDALNKGYMYANGDWVIILGSDDLLLPNVIAEIFSVRRDSKMALYGNVILSSSQQSSGGVFSKYKTMYFNIPHQAIFYPRSYYKKNDYCLKYRSAADHVYLMTYVCHPDAELLYLNIDISIYNDETGVSSVSQDEDFRKDQRFLVKKIYPFYLSIFYELRFMSVLLVKFLGIYSFLKAFLKK